MAQIEISAERERAASRWTRLTLRRNRSGAAAFSGPRMSAHQGRGPLVPMTLWAAAGNDGGLRSSPIPPR